MTKIITIKLSKPKYAQTLLDRLRIGKGWTNPATICAYKLQSTVRVEVVDNFTSLSHIMAEMAAAMDDIGLQNE